MRPNLFLLLGFVFISGCFRPPEMSNEPRISFNRLELNDDATLVLTFNVEDGDGNIGLFTEADYEPNESPEDLKPPYHRFSWIVDEEGNVVTKNSTDHTGSFYKVPVTRYYESYCLVKDGSGSEPNCALRDSDNKIIDYGFIENFADYYPAGDKVPFSEIDLRPEEYDCDVYELIPFYEFLSDTTFDPGEHGAIISQDLVIGGYDTVFVERNEFYQNLIIDIAVNDNGRYVPLADLFEVIEQCDPVYTTRFPVFDRFDFGRPVQGEIEFSINSTQFQNGAILDEALRFRFFIYDRDFNKSNVVEIPEFRILDLRLGDLTGS